jgi:hypothetical protein
MAALPSHSCYFRSTDVAAFVHRQSAAAADSAMQASMTSASSSTSTSSCSSATRLVHLFEVQPQGCMQVILPTRTAKTNPLSGRLRGGPEEMIGRRARPSRGSAAGRRERRPLRTETGRRLAASLRRSAEGSPHAHGSSCRSKPPASRTRVLGWPRQTRTRACSSLGLQRT